MIGVHFFRSLPHRQLRKDGAPGQDRGHRLLPHRQLRNGLANGVVHELGALPYRQFGMRCAG